MVETSLGIELVEQCQLNLKVQWPNKRAEIWALYMASCSRVGPTQIYSSSRGAVQVLNNGEVYCLLATQNHADL